jgi:hypothetical protein
MEYTKRGDREAGASRWGTEEKDFEGESRDIASVNSRARNANGRDRQVSWRLHLGSEQGNPKLRVRDKK